MKNTKFTATVVTESDKAIVQELRKRFALTEKEMLTAILHVVSNHEAQLLEISNSIKSTRVKRVRVTKNTEVTDSVLIEEVLV